MLIVMGSTGNRTLHAKVDSSLSAGDSDKLPAERKRLVDVLSELRNLLEDYSPAWYTEEHHRRVELALHASQKH